MQLSAPGSIDNGDQPFPPIGLPTGLAASRVERKCASRPGGGGIVKRLATIGERVTAVAHEVRNPLAILRSTLQNLEEEAGSADDVRRSCAFLRDEIDRLGRVTGSILGLARPVVPRPGRVRAGELFDRVKLLSPLEVREKELRLEIRDASGGAEIDADGDLLGQALLGLVTNAAQAAPERGRVALEAHASRGEIALSVSDNGPGIPPADRERISRPTAKPSPSGSCRSRVTRSNVPAVRRSIASVPEPASLTRKPSPSKQRRRRRRTFASSSTIRM